MIKKSIYLSGLTIFIVGSVIYAVGNSQSVKEVKLDEQFEVKVDEGVKLINYPLYLVVTDVDCSKDCNGDDVALYINYPTGYKALTISKGETLSYKGASLTLLSFSKSSATFYATLALAPHAPGTNVVDSTGTIWFITERYTRKAFPSAYVYRSYKFNTWDNIIPANSADMSLPIDTIHQNGPAGLIAPRNGSLVNDGGTVYIIVYGYKNAFSTDSLFRGPEGEGLGYSYNNVYPMNTSYIPSTDIESNWVSSNNQKHPDGTLINDGGTLYIMAHGGRYGVPTVAVLDSWGYWLTDAVQANRYDREAYYGGTLKMKPIELLEVSHNQSIE